MSYFLFIFSEKIDQCFVDFLEHVFDITIKTFQMFLCFSCSHQFKNQRPTHSLRCSKIYCLSLACPAVSASVLWHTRLKRASRFLPLSDWPTVDSLGAIVLLEAVRPSALSSVPRCVCPSSISHHRIRCLWKLHHTLLWLAVTVVVGCTLCVTDVCFYLSQELCKHRNVGYRCTTVFSCT